MTTNTENISKRLGELRKGLIDEGFTEDMACQIVLDLIRRGPESVAILTDV